MRSFVEPLLDRETWGKIVLRSAYRRREQLLFFGAFSLAFLSIGGFVCIHLWLAGGLDPEESGDGSPPVIVGLAGLLALSIIRQILEQSFSAWSASHEPRSRNEGFPATLPAQMLSSVTEILMLGGLVIALGQPSWQLLVVLVGLLITTYPMVRVALAEFAFSPRIVDECGNFVELRDTKIRISESVLCLALSALLFTPVAISIFSDGFAFGEEFPSDLLLWTLIALRGSPISITSLTLAIRHRLHSGANTSYVRASTSLLSKIDGRSCLVVFPGLKGQFFGFSKGEAQAWLQSEFPGREVIFFQEPFRQWDMPLRQAGALSKSRNVLTKIHKRAKSVEYVGVSGGAFAAILHASLLQPSEVIAFFPPARIHGLSLFTRDGLPKSKLTDLTQLVNAPHNLILVGSKKSGKSRLHKPLQQEEIASSLNSRIAVLEQPPSKFIGEHGFICRVRAMAVFPSE